MVTKIVYTYVAFTVLSLCHCNVTGDEDYDSGPYNVTFPIGSVTASVAISIDDDGVLEDDEVFVVSITSFTNGTVGTPGATRITITDPLSKYYGNNLYR